MGRTEVVVVSNRGPVSFAFDDDGGLTTTKAGGGLVNALGPAVDGTGAMWIAGAMDDADRRAVAEMAGGGGIIDAEGYRLRLLSTDPDEYGAYYDVIANSTLWYLHHGLFDRVRRPLFDRHWREAWEHYRRVNERFAVAVAECAPHDATVLVQDYHLTLLAPKLRELRPDLASVHFHHTPFCTPYEVRVLPADVAEELLTGLAAHDACGFHSPRWADSFTACCEQVLGRTPRTFSSPATANLDDVRTAAASDDASRAHAALLERVGGRKVIARNDRMELSKNVLRGFHAFDELLATRPEWLDRVCFVAYVYPSRQSLADYQSYRSECEALAARINATWGTTSWTPVLLSTGDDFPGAMAAMRAADVLLVNPVRDGLNLVAKEAVTVNERDCVLVLSTECGVFDELGAHAIAVNPFDVGATAAALHEGLTRPAERRRADATWLREQADRRGGTNWFDDLMAQVD